MWKMAQQFPRMRQLALEIAKLVSESEIGLTHLLRKFNFLSTIDSLRPFQTVQADVPDQLLSTIDGSRAFQTVQSAPKLVYAALLIRIGAVGNKIWITQLHPLLRLALFWGVYPGPCGPCTSPSWLLPHRGSVSTVVFDTQLFFPITHFLTHLLSVWRRLLLKPSGQPQKLFRQLF